jgi:hypothetical protein
MLLVVAGKRILHHNLNFSNLTTYYQDIDSSGFQLPYYGKKSKPKFSDVLSFFLPNIFEYPRSSRFQSYMHGTTRGCYCVILMHVSFTFLCSLYLFGAMSTHNKARDFGAAAL